jgi:hypothetical protein
MLLNKKKIIIVNIDIMLSRLEIIWKAVHILTHLIFKISHKEPDAVVFACSPLHWRLTWAQELEPSLSNMRQSKKKKKKKKIPWGKY